MENKATEDNRSWQVAGDRVLLYLRCLNFGAPEALELALKAIEKAKQNLGSGLANSPVTESMKVLRQLLAEQTDAMTKSSHSHTTWCDQSTSMVPLPPVCRASMLPEDIGFSHRRFLSRRRARSVERAGRGGKAKKRETRADSPENGNTVRGGEE